MGKVGTGKRSSVLSDGGRGLRKETRDGEENSKVGFGLGECFLLLGEHTLSGEKKIGRREPV